MWWYVALKEVELVFPDYAARIGIECHYTFLQIRSTARWILDVDPVTHHDRSRSPAIRNAPQKILAVQRPAVDETRFARDAVALRSSNLGPVTQSDTPLPLSDGADCETQ